MESFTKIRIFSLLGLKHRAGYEKEKKSLPMNADGNTSYILSKTIFRITFPVSEVTSGKYNVVMIS